MNPRLALALAALASCSSPDPATFCAAGTHFDSGSMQCTADVACGDGTMPVNGRCNAVCAAGTRLSAGACVPDYVEIVCGAGTSQDAGVCLPQLVSCGVGTVQRGQSCISLAVQRVGLPVPSGTTADVSQSNRGFFSHSGDSQYAVDFRMARGSSIVAARSGKVHSIREDSNIECQTQPCATPMISGCENDPCASAYNHVTIDHGDGTFGRYVHLQQNGALVAAGDTVCKGQPIGLSGNTGYSSGPHLHFEVEDLFRQSLPVSFDEVPGASGVAFRGGMFVSQNAAPVTCAESHAYSTCPPSLFGFLGIELDPGIPCSVAPALTPFVVSGRSLSGTWPEVIVGKRSANALGGTTAAWAYQCATLDAGKRFSVTLDLSDSPPLFYLMAGVAEMQCATYAGFSSSPRVRYGGP